MTGITVNRWPHGYAYEYNQLFDPEWPEAQQPHVIGRARFGRIAIANSDSGAAAYTDSAIDQAYRAVQELIAALTDSMPTDMTATPGPLFALALASISLIGPLAVHLFMPVIPAVKAALGLSDALAQLTFSIALFGMAFATLFYGSLSDRYGRRPVLLSGLALFLIGSAVSAAADSIVPLVLGRFLQAIGAGCGITLGRAIAQDVYGRDRLVKALAYLTMFYTIGPMISPIVGGILIDAFGWRSVFGFALVLGAHHRARRLCRGVRNPAAVAAKPRPRQCLAQLCRAVSPSALHRLRAAVGLHDRDLSDHRHGGIEPVEGHAASAVDRVRHLLPAVSVRLPRRQFHNQPHRQSRRQRNHGARRLAVVARRGDDAIEPACSPAW